MRRLITLFFLVFTLSGVAFAQQMSDDQVVQSVKSAQQMGKNQKQITTELMRDRKSTRLNSSHRHTSRMPSSA